MQFSVLCQLVLRVGKWVIGLFSGLFPEISALPLILGVYNGPKTAYNNARERNNSSGQGASPYRRYSPRAERHDPVELRGRQYSLDERRKRPLPLCPRSQAGREADRALGWDAISDLFCFSNAVVAGKKLACANQRALWSVLPTGRVFCAPMGILMQYRMNRARLFQTRGGRNHDRPGFYAPGH